MYYRDYVDYVNTLLCIYLFIDYDKYIVKIYHNNYIHIYIL